MSFRRKAVAVFALLAAVAAAAVPPASAASVDQAFSAAVAKVLATVHNDFLDGLSAEEKRAFEQLIDIIVERRGLDPGMHVFHYAPYEPTAMKRLMGRYGTRAGRNGSSPDPTGSWIGYASLVRRSLIMRRQRSKSAPTRSILLAKMMRGTL